MNILKNNNWKIEKQNICNICDQRTQINDILPTQKNGRNKQAIQKKCMC